MVLNKEMKCQSPYLLNQLKIIFKKNLFSCYLLFLVSFSCSIKSSRSLSLSLAGLFVETTTRFDVVVCTTFRLGSLITTFRLTTTREGSLTTLRSADSVTIGGGVGSFSGPGGVSTFGGVSIFGGGGGVGTGSLIVLVGGVVGSITGDGLITSLLTRLVVDARNSSNEY
jgi:hypothetical protein